MLNKVYLKFWLKILNGCPVNVMLTFSNGEIVFICKFATQLNSVLDVLRTSCIQVSAIGIGICTVGIESVCWGYAPFISSPTKNKIIAWTVPPHRTSSSSKACYWINSSGYRFVSRTHSYWVGTPLIISVIIYDIHNISRRKFNC